MKNILTLLFTLVVMSSYAQIKMQGVVRDSIGEPLELANIIAINKESNALESYAITDANGKYVISLGKNGNYNIQVSYIGLKSVDAIVESKEVDIIKNFD